MTICVSCGERKATHSEAAGWNDGPVRHDLCDDCGHDEGCPARDDVAAECHCQSFGDEDHDDAVERTVCGSYPGAVPWTIRTAKLPSDLAAELAESADCDYYTVDGETFPRAMTV